MTYRVEYDFQSEAAIDEQVQYLKDQSVSAARIISWLTRLYDRIEELRHHPRQCSKAELLSQLRGYEIHRMNFSEYAVFYRVDDERQVVEILDFRHGRRRPLEDAEEGEA